MIFVSTKRNRRLQIDLETVILKSSGKFAKIHLSLYPIREVSHSQLSAKLSRTLGESFALFGRPGFLGNPEPLAAPPARGAKGILTAGHKRKLKTQHRQGVEQVNPFRVEFHC